ncbi:MAG: NUDIX domain-containing protein [Planctomycetaceae bacterium]|nr:NUDIX domain-containing protein [Planctomycetaceae bacterium]
MMNTDIRPTRIGIAVICRDGDVLVGVREADAVLAGRHEFPGGKCLPGESTFACAEREALEETGLTVQAVRMLKELEHTYPHGHLILTFVLCDIIPSDAPLNPRFTWVSRCQLGSLNFPEANASIISMLTQPESFN